MVAAALLVPIGSALGAQGDLDPTFDGDGGRGISALRTADAVAVQPDGRIVVAGLSAAAFAFTVVRLEPGGGDDRSFGAGGVRTIDFGGFNWPRAVALQPDGKIVVSGGASNLQIARLDADGSPDTGFGNAGKR